MIKVNIDEVARLKRMLNGINRLDLMKMAFEKDGKDFHVSVNDRKEWSFTGMNNVDFIMEILEKEKNNE